MTQMYPVCTLLSAILMDSPRSQFALLELHSPLALLPLLTLPSLLNSPSLQQLLQVALVALSSLPELLPLPFLFTLPTLLDLNLYSLPALSFSLNNMHCLLFLHSLTSLPAMLYHDLRYLEHSAFGEG